MNGGPSVIGWSSSGKNWLQRTSHGASNCAVLSLKLLQLDWSKVRLRLSSNTPNLKYPSLPFHCSNGSVRLRAYCTVFSSIDCQVRCRLPSVKTASGLYCRCTAGSTKGGRNGGTPGLSDSGRKSDPNCRLSGWSWLAEASVTAQSKIGRWKVNGPTSASSKKGSWWSPLMISVDVVWSVYSRVSVRMYGAKVRLPGLLPIAAGSFGS